MGKALQPLVIVLLILGIISLILGSMLFSQREVLKGRTLVHEEAVVKIAQNLQMEGLDPNRITQQMKDYNTMRTPLDLVAVAAQNKHEMLVQTKADLDATRTELANTKTELEGTKNDLAAAQQKIVDLNDTIEKKNIELVEANGRIVQLEQDKNGLQLQIDDLNNQLLKAEDEMRDLQDKIVTLDKVIKDYEAKEGTPGTARVPVGTMGRVLVVNPDWNFVVLDIGSEQGLVPNAEMLVHRKDQLIGKVRIGAVEKTLAIAEILRDWTTQPINEGDYVLY
jgi:chromosome segregation ATPase